MVNSVFNFFKEQMFLAYPYLNGYVLEFTQQGEEEFFLHIYSKKDPLLMVSWEVKDKIKDFAKLFSIKIKFIIEDTSISGSTSFT